MFKKKKNDQAAAKCANSITAKILIMREVKVLDELMDGEMQGSYVQGMIKMAFELGAIELNDRSALSTMVHEKVQEIKSMGKPVYKKKGCYEYRGYYILKIHNLGDGAANWGVQKIGEEKMLAVDLTFKEAVKAIYKLI